MSPTNVESDEALAIAIDAYTFASPLVLMEYHRRVLTNVESADGLSARGPGNRFTHVRTFPDASERDVVAPNSDTLYSSLWFDVSTEPLVIGAPESTGRYYLLPMIDAWTDVFASPGTRTTGTAAVRFALVGPGWNVTLPDGMAVIKSPTSFGWVVGRTEASRETFAEINRFQDALQAVPLSQWGKPYAPKGKVDPHVNMKIPPVAQVRKLSAAEFWTVFGKLWKANPPHSNDYPILHRMARLGLKATDAIVFDRLTAQTRDALEQAVPIAQKRIDEAFPRTGILANGWRINNYPIGTWGTAYLARAVVAWWGIGANVPEDAVYPFGITAGDGQPFDSARRYVLHFEKEQLPPVNAFWSVTMYDAEMFYAKNSIDRYAIGDRDKLRFNDDGSLDLYIQRESTGEGKETNWLPTPAAGKFVPIMRLYWPKDQVLLGGWQPPPMTVATTARGAGHLSV